MAAVKLEKEFRRRGIPVEINKGRIMDMDPLMRQTNPDLVIATAVVKRQSEIPIFDGVPLLSGIGVEKLFEDVFAYVDQLIENDE